MSTERSSDGLSRVVLIVLALVLGLPLVMMVFAMPLMGLMGWGWSGGMMTGGLWPLWGIGMMLVWLLLLAGGGYLLYRALAGVGSSPSTDPALEELRVAYARGDLTEEEFEERRATLRREESP